MKPTYTIIHGHACNVDSQGVTQSGWSKMSRVETRGEQQQNHRVAVHACKKLGIPLQACAIDYYGETLARVSVQDDRSGQWQWVTVSAE